uniref:Myb-like domain-containing protein n=1 Tax=Globisporangium ultimum (strain ATCC 200006 / CBS 805.95 / DAOM BR144) TaxID=431595 RepID=K3WVM1_GLOUD
MKTSLTQSVWSAGEDDKFLIALKTLLEGLWKAIVGHIGTRSARQVQTHAHRYDEKVVLSERHLDDDMIDLQRNGRRRRCQGADRR